MVRRRTAALGARARSAVRRGLRPIAGGSGGRDGFPLPDRPDEVLRRQAARAAQALDVVREIESREAGLPGADQPHDFLALDRAVRRAGYDESLETMLPASLRGDWDPDQESVGTVRAPVAADLLVLAKFDLSEQVKLRAAYGGARRTTVAVQPVRPDGTCGITKAVRSHEIVGRYAPGLMPEPLGHGELSDGLRYLVEGWVEGRPLMSAGRMAEKVSFILEGLSRVHEGYGVHARRVSEVWESRFPEQWQAVREAELVPEQVGTQVAALIAADRRLRVSWSHGDLVASNVLGTDDGVVIIDWEHAGERPVMHDAAKLHLFAADKGPLLDLLLAEWGRGSATDGYTPAEELAVLHARFLSLTPQRMAKLAGHKRRGVFARQVRRQAELLGDVLARAV